MTKCNLFNLFFCFLKIISTSFGFYSLAHVLNKYAYILYVLAKFRLTLSCPQTLHQLV